MLVSLKRLYACGLLGFGVLVALQPSCVENQKSLFIRQIQFRQAPDCTVDADPSALFVTSGLVDAGLANSYSIEALVGSQLFARGSTRYSESEPNRILLQYADVKLKVAGAERAHFSVGLNGTIDATTDLNPAYGLAGVQILPPSIMQQLQGEVIASAAPLSLSAEFTVVGKTLGGDRIESAEFTFPLTVCYGCLVTFPAGSSDASLGYPNCAAASASTSSSNEAQVCVAGFDAPIDCRACRGRPACTPCSEDAHCGAGARCDRRRGVCVPNG